VSQPLQPDTTIEARPSMVSVVSFGFPWPKPSVVSKLTRREFAIASESSYRLDRL
jgi:hypothetical protein